MIIARPKGCNRTCGKSQGYLGLPLRDEIAIDMATGELTPSMITVWEPTPDEIARIVKGEFIVLRILGTVPPPQMLTVGDDYEGETPVSDYVET